MAIVKVHNKARNITYVYESFSYWDKELKQPRSHRKLIGRIDPVSGDIVPTGRLSYEKQSVSVSVHSDTKDYKALYQNALSLIEEKDAIIADLSKKLKAAEKRNASYRKSIDKASDILLDSLSGKETIHG